ncbi:MAG TPA: DUF5947 family protein [Streptosporangiaceae bacterium]|nr:DUF5947 family protein [Streptosporangiaceae bacterium]
MTGRGGLGRFVPGAPAAPPPTRAPAGPAGPAAGRAPLPSDPATAVPASFAATEAAQEKCEMCAEVVPADHAHVADLENSSLLCACRACYLLFTQAEAGRGRYRAIPDRYLADHEHPLAPGEWDELEIPVGLAFFLRSSARDEVAAFYPSPAGATECRLDLAAWARLTAGHPLLTAMESDVEAILIAKGDDGIEHFLVPIDACYELAGRMRLTWRGFDGGQEARDSIGEFLGTVRTRARQLAPEA